MSGIENEIALNTNFVKLDQALKRFNIFDALGVRNHEIRHSNFLGYLLDPNQSHDLGAEFLIEFLRNVSRESAEVIPLLDLNLPLAQVEREKKFQNATDSSLDLFVDIPLMSGGGKFVLAIENKLNSTQANGQLSRYSEHLHREVIGTAGKLLKVFLTLNGEDANSDGWRSLSYFQVVTPTIEALIDSRSDTSGDYFIQILKDYLAAITRDADSSDLDDVVVDFVKNKPQLVQSIKEDKSANSLPRVRVLFPRAYSYVRGFDNDPRVKVLTAFKATKFELGSNLKIETSSRSYLRLSFLTEENGKKLATACAHPTRPWLESKRHLALELRLDKSLKDDVATGVNGKVWLMLGPTDENYPYRKELVKFLNGWEEIKDVSPRYTKILLDAQHEKSFRNLNPEGVNAWIQSKFFKIAQDIQKDINKKLEIFFKDYCF
ncbi:MAG: PD-(D/E)XK nuclease family protein [Rhodoferax sp.]|uniref:PDDEXK-like family protein n=1 Tax=Rhodoferax sp. TaxID=50421 RepID=UPI002ACEC215|nr:PD-(D/E)XK nuclease family protein [Rhodoferax sp.]MDZ7890872.1 PD-(D/E)XK nuclease family protein [Rhodoferax sp.]